MYSTMIFLPAIAICTKDNIAYITTLYILIRTLFFRLCSTIQRDLVAEYTSLSSTNYYTIIVICPFLK